MINWKSEKAKTPLMCAVEAKQVDIVNYLLEIPGITLDSLTKKGKNIVHIAAWYSLDCLKALQSTPHMSSSLFLATDKGGWGVLHRACASDNIDTLKWMMELRTTTLDGGNDVLAPSNEGYSDALPLLFEDKLNEKTQKGCTPLLVACEYQHKDMVEYLLSLPEVDPFASTSMDGSEEGNTGLHIAAIHDSPDIADLLIRRGCPIRATNGEEYSNGKWRSSLSTPKAKQVQCDADHKLEPRLPDLEADHILVNRMSRSGTLVVITSVPDLDAILSGLAGYLLSSAACCLSNGAFS
eukprot:Em0003g643a